MKPEVNSQRRKLFAKFGIGALSAGILSAVPFKLFASTTEKKNSEKLARQHADGSVSITINPMAVKREKRK